MSLFDKARSARGTQYWTLWSPLIVMYGFVSREILVIMAE